MKKKDAAARLADVLGTPLDQQRLDDGKKADHQRKPRKS